MKAYLFDVETGLYEGETFEDADMLQYEDGVTTIPPPDYGHGQVAAFDRLQQAWAIIPAGIARQLLSLANDATKESSHEPL